jgi:energy-coupling factor transporter ATP-binding protein EcfA2
MDWGAVAAIVGFIAIVALVVVWVLNPGGARDSIREAIPDVLDAFGDEQAAERLRQHDASRAAAPQAAEEPAAPLALRTWLDKANHTPDKNPHLVATGPSGSGKTTLIMALLADRPGQFVICTPKHADDDPWGGFPAVRPAVVDGRFSFDAIKAAASAVYQEMLRRNTQGSRGAEWLTLVLDDYGILIGKIPELSEWVLDMVALGRSVRVRIVLLSTETNVKAWGWEGRSEARESCLWIECEEDTRRAVMYRWSKRKQAQEIDTTPLYELAQRARLAGRVWPGLVPVAGPALDRPVSVVSVPVAQPALRERRVGYAAVPDGDELLRRALAEPLAVEQSTRAPEHLARAVGGIAAAEQQSSALAALEAPQSTPAEQYDLRAERGLVAFLVSEGLSANEIVARVKGDSTRIYALVRELRGG